MPFWLCLIVGLFLQSGVVFAQDVPLHLTLSQALKRADTMSVAVIVADARVEQAIARLSQARAVVLPQITGSISGSRQTRDLRATGMQFSNIGQRIGPFNSFDARGKVIWDIFDAGALERLRAAKSSKELSTLNLQKTKEDTLALIATMYLQAQRAAGEASVFYAFMKRDRKALELTQTQFVQGTASVLDLRTAKANYIQSRYLYRSAQTQAKQLRLDLAAALKIDAHTSIIFDEDNYKGLLSEIKDTELDLNVQVAAQQLKVKQQQEGAARADYLPKISALGDYGRSGESPDHGSNTYSVGLQATIPIWEGGSKQAASAEAKAETKEAQANLEETKRQNEVRLIDAKDNISQAKVLVQSKIAQQQLSQQQLSLAHDRFKAGMAHELDLITAIAQNISAKDQKQEAIAQLWMAKINLAHALGQMHDLIK